MLLKYFVGGFPHETTKEEFTAAMLPYGQVVEAFCVRRYGIGRGFGFVTFQGLPDPTFLAPAAVVVNDVVVGVKEALPEDSGALDPNEDSSDPFKYFIGGLPNNCVDNDLVAAMQIYGSVKEASVVTNPEGLSRGFGFVTFHSAPTDALLAGGITVMGSDVSVKESVPQRDLQNRKIFVGGLRPEISEEHLYGMFVPHGAIVETQIMRDHTTSLSRGFGFVTFQTSQGAQDALHFFENPDNITVRPCESKTSRDEIQRRRQMLASKGKGGLGGGVYGAGKGKAGKGPYSTHYLYYDDLEDPYAAAYAPRPAYPPTVLTDWDLKLQLAEEQRRRAELEERLAMYEEGQLAPAPPSRGLRYAAPRRAYLPLAGKGAPRYRPY